MGGAPPPPLGFAPQGVPEAGILGPTAGRDPPAAGGPPRIKPRGGCGGPLPTNRRECNSRPVPGSDLWARRGPGACGDGTHPKAEGPLGGPPRALLAPSSLDPRVPRAAGGRSLRSPPLPRFLTLRYACPGVGGLRPPWGALSMRTLTSSYEGGRVGGTGGVRGRGAMRACELTPPQGLGWFREGFPLRPRARGGERCEPASLPPRRGLGGPGGYPPPAQGHRRAGECPERHRPRGSPRDPPATPPGPPHATRRAGGPGQARGTPRDGPGTPRVHIFLGI